MQCRALYGSVQSWLHHSISGLQQRRGQPIVQEGMQQGVENALHLSLQPQGILACMRWGPSRSAGQYTLNH